MGIKKGFTLIELMIVFAIILILVPTVTPKVNSIRLDAKNRKVESNLLMIKAFLEDRKFLDRHTIYQEYEVNKSSLNQVLAAIQNSVGISMRNVFSASRALDNPFTDSKSIVYNTPDISAVTSDCSVIVNYDTGSLPADEKSVSITNGEMYLGKAIVTIYQDGYLGYGIGSDGRVVGPFIIKMPEGNVYQVGDVPPPVEPPAPSSYDDLLGFYQYNALNIIDPAGISNFTSQEFNISGNTFILSDKIILNTNVNTNNTDNLAFIASTVQSSGNTNLNSKNLFFDSTSSSPVVPSMNTDANLFVSGNYKYSQFPGQYGDRKFYYLSTLETNSGIYTGGWPLIAREDYQLLNADSTHFKNFVLQQLPLNTIQLLKDERIENGLPPGLFK